ncbi:helix-turn-helix domain-containing protein [Methylomonas sp. AM2-LC]|uniref:helix-turn-helix domain-containing protein n=1 Tax=Methylomonas sp. AM2-LC TaxID=3153301 RepID=UPI003266389A
MLIQKLRLKHGWSQQQLADLSGLSIRTIQRIERGQSASVESLKSLAAVFEIDFSSLKTESGMVSNLNDGISREEILALEHVRKVKRFYIHLIQYFIVIGSLTILNLLQTPHHIWVLWPALGWGLGLVFHASSIYNFLPILGAEWERKQVEKRLGRSL